MKREELKIWLKTNGFEISGDVATRANLRIILKPQSLVVRKRHGETNLWYSIDGSRYANAKEADGQIISKTAAARTIIERNPNHEHA